MKKNMFYTLAAAAVLLCFPYSVNGIQQDNIVSVNVLNHIYYGTLEANGKESTFTTLPDSEASFSITGSWSDSQEAFNGECTISYEDGTTQDVTYKKGLIRKKVTTTYPDGTYQTFTTSRGKPCKKIQTYSSEGELISLDWFHRCTPVSSLLQNAVSPNYDEWFSNPYDYSELPIKVSGTVISIYESASTGYMKIKDESDNLYLFKYPNASIQQFVSSNIENVSVDDSIEIYGFFDSINNYEEEPISFFEHSLGWEMNSKTFLDELIVDDDFLSSVRNYSKVTDSDLEEEIPILKAFYWKTNETDINPLHLTGSYEELCKYPYYYKSEKFSITGKIVYENTNSSAGNVILLIQKENSSEIYGATYETTDYTSLLGETVSISGSSDGNCKILYYKSDTKVMGYALYPNIKVTDLES